MVNEEFRKKLNEYIESVQIEEDVLLLDNHSYDNSIIGFTEDFRPIYDYDLMVEELMMDEGWDETEAVEWLEYNTLRALPYMGERAPIILMTKKEMLEKF